MSDNEIEGFDGADQHLAGAPPRLGDTVRAASPKTKPRNRRAAGRPRRLTTEQILETALSVGLENLTMAEVARRLHVRVTVLYNYFPSRDDLVHHATVSAFRRRRFPRDIGQHWSVYAAQHASALFGIYVGPGNTIPQYLAGGIEISLGLDVTEEWLSALLARNFSPADALTLQRQVGEIALGGAVTWLHAAALERAGSSYPKEMNAAIDARPASDLPLLHANRAESATSRQVWQQSLIMVFRSVAVNRGEALAFADIENALFQ